METDRGPQEPWVVRTNWTFVVSAFAVVISLFTLVPAGFSFFGVPTPVEQQQREQSSSMYFRSLALDEKAPDGTPASGVGLALTYASPDSPASHWAEIAQNLWAAYTLTGGKDSKPWSVKSVGGGYQQCQSKDCHLYSHVVFDSDNRVKDFSYDGVPVKSATLAPMRAQDRGDVSLAFAGGETNQRTGQDIFALQITNVSNDDLTIDPTSAEFFRDDNGQMASTTLVSAGAMVPGQRLWIYGNLKTTSDGMLYFKISHSSVTEWESIRIDR